MANPSLSEASLTPEAQALQADYAEFKSNLKSAWLLTRQQFPRMTSPRLMRRHADTLLKNVNHVLVQYTEFLCSLDAKGGEEKLRTEEVARMEGEGGAGLRKDLSVSQPIPAVGEIGA